MTCEFCDGLGAVLISDVIEVAITEKDLYKEKIIRFENGDEDFQVLTFDGGVIIDDDTKELVILCDWCDGFGK